MLTGLWTPQQAHEAGLKVVETSRRRLFTRTGSIALAAGAGLTICPKGARTQTKTLRIMQWRHFVPGYDDWFKEIFAKQWGEANDTKVIVDNVGFGWVQRMRENTTATVEDVTRAYLVASTVFDTAGTRA